MKKKCLFCGKILKRNTYKTGLKERPATLRKRNTCNLVCRTKYRHFLLGDHLWNRELVEKFFVKNRKKFGTDYYNWPVFFRGATEKYFGSWQRLMHYKGVKPQVDFFYPKWKRYTPLVMRYLKEEHDISPGKAFELGVDSLCGYESMKRTNTFNTINKLVEVGKIKKLRRVERSKKYPGLNRGYLYYIPK